MRPSSYHSGDVVESRHEVRDEVDELVAVMTLTFCEYHDADRAFCASLLGVRAA